jgi:hypothetical protein
MNKNYLPLILCVLGGIITLTIVGITLSLPNEFFLDNNTSTVRTLMFLIVLIGIVLQFTGLFLPYKYRIVTKSDTPLTSVSKVT